MKAVESDQEVTNVKRSFLAMLLLFCVVLTGCQAGSTQAGKYPVLTDAAQVSASAQTEETTQTPTESPTEAPTAAVQPKVTAPAHISESFTSNTGKTVIRVDAAVTMPDAEKMYLIPIESMAFDDAMVSRLAELVWPGLGSRKMKIEDENDSESVEGKQQKNKYFRHLAYILQKGARQGTADVQAGTSYFSMQNMMRRWGLR